MYSSSERIFSGVPSFFRCCCMKASQGGNCSYEMPARNSCGMFASLLRTTSRSPSGHEYVTDSTMQ